MNFSRYKISDKYYGGSERKIGVIISGSEYMLKFQKVTAFGTRYNHISEHLGSRIFEMAGIPAQETFLGTYKGESVVACRNFIEHGEHFVPFNDVGESSLDQEKERYQYTYSDIMRMLSENSKLTEVEETIDVFWKIFIVDAFLGNFDRHGGNWGFLKKENRYRLAPVFDNGSCLFPNMTDESDMIRIMNSADETNMRIYGFPTSQIKLNGNKSSYFEVINSLSFPECNKALVEIFNKIDMTKITELISQTEEITEVHKEFYCNMLTVRYNKILKASYDLLRNME